jgi:hypothetical protein
MYLRETGCEGVDWINMAQEGERPEADCFKYANEPLGSRKRGTFLGQLSVLQSKIKRNENFEKLLKYINLKNHKLQHNALQEVLWCYHT